MKVAFLLSPPRAGSTFLERMLAAHPQIAAEGESWSLLPLLYGTRRIGLSAEYGHQTYVNALSDLCTAAGKTTELYDNAVRAFAEELYRPLCGEKAVFVDKTPRYGLAIDELNRIFPDAPMIFLWRNPLSVIASMVTTWHGGRWRLGGNYIDLLEAYPRLIDGYESQNPRHLSLAYEDLVLDPRSSLHKVLRHLELPYDDAMLSDFTRVNFPGRYGDPTGVKDYHAVSDKPLEKWREVIAGVVRKRWAGRYLSSVLGTQRLEKIGYDHDALTRELDDQSSQMSGALSDLYWQWVSRIEYRLKRFKWGYHWRP